MRYPATRNTQTPSDVRPRPSRRRPDAVPCKRDGRTLITAGPGKTPNAPGLAVLHSMTMRRITRRPATRCCAGAEHWRRLVGSDSPDLVTAMRLLDHLKERGFQFQRVAPGVDGPLVGQRVSGDWIDLIHVEGFSRDCFAWRQRTSSLIVAGEGLVQRRVTGSALDVFSEVLSWESGA